jgi:hypothetical protein
MAEQINYQARTSRRSQMRAGVIAALTNSGAPSYPTMAEDRVFDSKQDPLKHDGSGRKMPVICVYSDTTKYDVIQNEKFGPFSMMQQLIVEISIGGVNEQAITDAEIEDLLDTFEDQVMDALFGQKTESAHAFSTMYSKLLDIDSMRLANSDQSHRFATRDIVITVQRTSACANLENAFPQLLNLGTALVLNDEIQAVGVDEIIPDP